MTITETPLPQSTRSTVDVDASVSPAPIPLPRAATTLTVAVFVIASLAPSLLPRSIVVQTVVTGLAVAAALAVVWVGRLLARALRVERRTGTTVRVVAASVSAVSAAAAVVADDHWQNSVRAAMGVPQTSLAHWPLVLIGSAVVAAAVTGAALVTRKVAHRLGFGFCAAAVVIGAMLTQTVVGPALGRAAAATFAATNDFVDTDFPEPTSPTRAGSPQSLITWDSLGSEGRKFVAGGNDDGTVRTYVGLESAPTTTDRVTLAVDELSRAGGFDRSAVVIAVPTGSGWIDAAAATGVDTAFGGDAAMVGVQYSMAPSWATFLFGRAEAESSAQELFTAVAEHIDALPPGRPHPRLYVYGQSLGSVGGSSIFDGADDREARACGTVWAGPPAGAVRQDGAVVVAHTSDPVVWWSTRLLLMPPDLSRAVPDAPVPAWIPVITYLQTTADVIGAIGTPVGHGHRYGTEQGTRLDTDCRT